MQNDFEKDMAQRMQEFSIVPQPEIWQRVEAALPPEKKRRRIALWWWLLPLAVLMGIGFWIIVGKKITTSHSTIIQQTPAENKKIQQPILVDNTNDSLERKPSAETTAKVAEQIANKLHTDTAKYSGNLRGTATATAKTNNVVRLHTSLNRAKQLVHKKAVAVTNSAAQSSIVHADKETDIRTVVNTKEQAETPLQNAGSNKLPRNTDSTFDVVKGGSDSTTATGETAVQKSIDTIAKKADTSNIAHADTSKKMNTYKPSVSWMLEAGAGLSWQQFSVNRSGSNYYSSPQNSTGPITGLPVYNAPFQTPKSGYGFSMGISRRQTITPHWSWAVALRYQLITSVQRAGYPLTSNYSLAARDNYSTGDTLSYNNYLHLLQVMPRISYTINPKAHSPISFSTSFSVGYVFVSNQLLPSYRNYVYVQSPQGLVRWQCAAEVGANLFFRKKINIGISYQHGLNNLVQPDLISILRWRVLQMQVGLPLFHHSSQ